MMSDKCLICFDDLASGVSLKTYLGKADVICGHCRRRFKICNNELVIDQLKIQCCYYYDDFVENLLFQFKEGRDVALKSIFMHQQLTYIKKKYRGYTLVYVPSAIDKFKERGFWPLELIYEQVNLPKKQLFIKNAPYKQSHQEYFRRNQIKKVIELIPQVTIPKKVLLVDDMCTSGNSLKACFDLISDKCECQALCVCVNERLFEEKITLGQHLVKILKRCLKHLSCD